MPDAARLRMSQANLLTTALTAQILRARGLLPPAEEPLAPPPLGPLTLADWAATRAYARALRAEEDLAGAGVPAGGPSYRALAAALIAIPMSDNFGLLVDVWT